MEVFHLIPTTNIKETERKILTDMYKFALELSNKDIPQLYELGHYLTDNLISKICMVIGKEKGINFEYTDSRGIQQTRGFKWLYEKILKKTYITAPIYDEIKKLHIQRNVYQHRYWAVKHHLHKEYALKYIEKAKNIMIAANIIKSIDKIQPTNYLTKEIMTGTYDETLKSKLLKCYDALTNICDFYIQINQPEIEFEKKIDRSEVFISLKTLEKFQSECFEYLTLYYNEDKALLKHFGPTTIKIVYNQLDIYISLNGDYIDHINMNLGNKYVEEKSEIESLLEQLQNKINEF